MRVLVWQSFGNTNVYAAETPLQFMKIYESLKAEVVGWDLDDVVGELYEQMGTSTSGQEASIHFASFVQRYCRDHESFEAFEFVGVENL